MKRIIGVLLALVLMLGVCASVASCGGDGEGTTADAQTTEIPTPDQSGDATAEQSGEGDTTTEAAASGYKVTVTDKDGNPIANVPVQMCDSNGCKLPKPTGADGVITFDYEPSDFHVIIAGNVEGYVVDTAKEYDFEAGSFEMTIVLEKAQ